MRSRLSTLQRAIAISAVAVAGIGIVTVSQPRSSAAPAVVSDDQPRLITVGLGKGTLAAPHAELPLTYARAETTLRAALPDAEVATMPDGSVASLHTDTLIFNAPNGMAIGILPPTTTAGAPTAVPVVDNEGEWLRVLLPSRPDSTTGWIRSAGISLAHSRWALQISLGSRALTVLHDGVSLGVWQVAVGAPATPTPVTRTFVTALVQETGAEASTLGPWALTLGTHSQVLTSFDGGPGTIAVHGWHDPSVFGSSVSNGCVRAPSDAMQLLTHVPLGSPVVISS